MATALVPNDSVIRPFRQWVVLQLHRTSHNRHSTFDKLEDLGICFTAPMTAHDLATSDIAGSVLFKSSLRRTEVSRPCAWRFVLRLYGSKAKLIVIVDTAS